LSKLNMVINHQHFRSHRQILQGTGNEMVPLMLRNGDEGDRM
jgi:hypothetical protein